MQSDEECRASGRLRFGVVDIFYPADRTLFIMTRQAFHVTSTNAEVLGASKQRRHRGPRHTETLLAFQDESVR
jgi:hypothetical protein